MSVTVFSRKARTAASLLSFIRKARIASSLPVEEIIEIPYRIGSVTPFQVREELTELAKVLQNAKPRRLLEIGTNRGGTFFVLCQVSAEDAKVISVDMPGAMFGDKKPKFYTEFVISRMKRPRQTYRRVVGDSHSLETLRRVEGVLCGEKLDFLFIDGDHTYNGVRQDFDMFSPLVRSGGIVGFHDIAVHPPETHCEVNRLWEEIKSNYRCREIIANPSQGWAGIGLVYV